MSRPVVGVVGGGQLARMLQQAAIDLDVELRLLVSSPDDAAAAVTPDVEVGEPSDAAAVARLAAGCDVVTIEHERLDLEVLDELARTIEVAPHPRALAQLIDKAAQRALLDRLGIARIPHEHVTVADLTRVARSSDLPLVVKTARGGYDGRGVTQVHTDEDVRRLQASWPGDAEVLVEPLIRYDAEIAVQVVRSASGELASYPVVETVQRDGICHAVLAPAGIGPALADQATAMASDVAVATCYVGVLAVELFVVGDTLIVNELAPRVHNSGHHTIQTCVTSQFQNHLRAVLGWPLGSPAMPVPAAAMVNVIAQGPTRAPLSRIPLPAGVAAHDYGKSARAGRKVGHVTAVGDDVATALADAARVAEQWSAPTGDGLAVGVGGGAPSSGVGRP